MIALVFAAAVGASEAALEAPPTIDAHRLGVEEHINLDGRLDEPAWQIAVPASDFRQREPAEGAPATEETEVRVLYDSNTLYVGVVAHDHEPDRLLARVLRRDKLMEPADSGLAFLDDGVALLFDPFRDRRNGVVFATNPNGAEFDALITDEGAASNVDWRGVWRVAARRNADGWSAEFAIPFRTLRYPTDAMDEPWGFNVYRSIRRKNEEVLWSGWRREGGGFHRVSRAGALRQLTGLPRKHLNLEVKPWLLGGGTQQPDGASSRLNSEWGAGLDAKWEVKPGMVLDATVKPDFAQVEADDVQINLTRFSLFFPEKREFFLENAGIFDFGARGLNEAPPFLLFFSRRIGIVGGGKVPVLGGVRLSGRAGRQTIGLLDAYTGRDERGLLPTNFGVMRWKRDIGASSYVGAALSDRRNENGSNTGFGADASFWPTVGLNLHGFVAGTRTSGPGGEGLAYRGVADYTGERFGFLAEHLAIDPNARTDMGFINRTDIRRSILSGRVTFRPHFAGLRRLDVRGGGNYITRVDGTPQDGYFTPSIMAEWNSGDSITVHRGVGFVDLEQQFLLSQRVPVPAGDYETRYYGMTARSSRNRPLSFSLGVNRSNSYGGHVDAYQASAELNNGSHLALRLATSHSHVRLAGGGFDASVATLRLVWQFSTNIVANALIQYNSLDRKLLTNVRLNIIHRPGSDFYVVFNEERGDGITTWPIENRGLAVKLTYLSRF